MTPGQLIDEFKGLLTGGDSAALMSNLKNQVRDNPLPLSLVGIGLAWLMMGQGGAAKPQASSDEGRVSPHWDTGSRPASAGERTGQAWPGDEPSTGGATGAMAGAMDAVTGAARSTADSVSDAAHAAAQSGSETWNSVKAKASDQASAASQQAGKAAASVQNMVMQEPLALAALGLALGTAIGVMLPHTEFEDRQLGPTASKLRDKAADLADKGMDGAKDVAATAYQSVKDEADAAGPDLRRRLACRPDRQCGEGCRRQDRGSRARQAADRKHRADDQSRLTRSRRRNLLLGPMPAGRSSRHLFVWRRPGPAGLRAAGRSRSGRRARLRRSRP